MLNDVLLLLVVFRVLAWLLPAIISAGGRFNNSRSKEESDAKLPPCPDIDPYGIRRKTNSSSQVRFEPDPPDPTKLPPCPDIDPYGIRRKTKPSSQVRFEPAPPDPTKLPPCPEIAPYEPPPQQSSSADHLKLYIEGYRPVWYRRPKKNNKRRVKNVLWKIFCCGAGATLHRNESVG